MNHYDNGSWELDLGGICGRELYILADLLKELARTGEVNGVEFDADTLKARFDSSTGDVDLYDDYGNTTLETEEE